MPPLSLPPRSLVHSILASACLALAPPAWAQNRSMPDERAIAQEMEKARERAAQIFERMDRTPLPRTPAFNTQTPPAPQRMEDPLAVAERMRAQPRMEDAGDGHDLVALVSFSMPKASLERLARESAAYGAVLVFRGPKDGSLRETLKAIEPLAKLGANAVLHPPAFRAHGVTQVPVYLFGRPLAADCEERARCADVLRLDGDVSIRHALERMAASSHPLARHAQARLDAARGAP